METTLTYYHLGSWTTITDEEGNIEQELSFDAWGNFRNPYTWTGANTTRPMFDRGFTGHEHLYGFGLINMKFALSESRAKFYLGYAERCKLGEANGLWGITKTRFGINYGCVSYAARALWTAGDPTIPIIYYLGPSVLWTQLAIRQLGIQASPFLIDSFSFGNTQYP